jgi:hypothetical protein
MTSHCSRAGVGRFDSLPPKSAHRAVRLVALTALKKRSGNKKPVGGCGFAPWLKQWEWTGRAQKLSKNQINIWIAHVVWAWGNAGLIVSDGEKARTSRQATQRFFWHRKFVQIKGAEVTT